MSRWGMYGAALSHAALAVALLAPAAAHAQCPLVALSTATDKTSYLEGEPIKLQITVANITGADLITEAGFFAQAFEQKFTFIGPAGEVLRFTALPGGAEPGPPACIQERCTAVRVEVIATADSTTTVVNDARTLYALTGRTGHFTATASVPVRSFAAFVEEPDGSRFAFGDDPGGQFCDPATSNTIAFDIVPLQPIVSAAAEATVTKIIVGPGVNPGARLVPVERATVRLFRTALIPAEFQPVGHQTQALVWQFAKPHASARTDAQGRARFERLRQDDYVMMSCLPGTGGFVCSSTRLNAGDPGWAQGSLTGQLRLLQRADGSQVGGRTTRVTGSELLITEPEYVIWDSTQELYPFIFESAEDWSVTTSIAPPEGFVADHAALSTEVDNELKAVQFTITDVGSRWEETEVTYTVTHQGKSEKIKNKIGIEIAPGLAGAKGLGRFGDTASPGLFKGGKKQKNK